MFRRIYEALTRRRTQVEPPPPAEEVRAPDPYVWRLPDPYEARWRRWAKRSRAAGYRLPFPAEEACWQTPARPAEPRWTTTDDVVRPYVLRP
ncbi:hypothetical protein [Streptomyces antibioticus]|uniref:hypothetical protein n=1 Tax=Streptomyces antibioticus TaxID=1890 RepID=UPI003D71164B